MLTALGKADPQPRAITATDLRLLRIMLGFQIALGLLWGVSMLFFARQIVLGPPDGPHIEKIAMEGARPHDARLRRVPRLAGAIALRRCAPDDDLSQRLWTLTDLVYIPLLGLSEIDFYAKTIVNAFLAIGLWLSGRRAGII